MAQALFLTCNFHRAVNQSISEAPSKNIGKHGSKPFDSLSDLIQDSVLY